MQSNFEQHWLRTASSYPKPENRRVTLRTAQSVPVTTVHFGAREKSKTGQKNSPKQQKKPWYKRLLQPFIAMWNWFTGLFTKSLRRLNQDLKKQLNDLTTKLEDLKRDKSQVEQENTALHARQALLQSENKFLRELEQAHQKYIEAMERSGKAAAATRSPDAEREALGSLWEKINQPLPYANDPPRQPPIPDRLSGKNIIHPGNLSREKPRNIVALKLPAEDTIASLKPGDEPLSVVVPGSPSKPPQINEKAMVKLGDKNLDQVQETDFTFNFNPTWSRLKCVRDLFQNFSDSHGMTLNGVSVHTQKSDDGLYTVRVEGQGDYHYEYIKSFLSSKGDEKMSAGGFGEGTKVMTLCLLKLHGAEKVTFSSRNWALEYFPADQVIADVETKRIMRKLYEVPDKPNKNYVEIQTRDPALIADIYKGLNFFYHDNNPDFANPSVSSDVGGFEFLGKDSSGIVKKGNVYHANQRYEYDKAGGWENLVEGINIWTKQNIFKEKGIADRDRSALDTFDLETLTETIAESLTDQQLVDAIFQLKEVWPNRDIRKMMAVDENNRFQALMAESYSGARILLQNLVYEACKDPVEIAKSQKDKPFVPPKPGFERKLGIQFPKQYIAESHNVSDFIKGFLERKGYVICPSYFQLVGMKTIADAWKEVTHHTPASPSAKDIRRINIMKEAVSILRKYPEFQETFKGKPLITREDIEKPIYLFKPSGVEGQESILGEYGNTHIWISQPYLRYAKFGEVLSTYVHEILHKYGSDGDPVFGYALTDLLKGNFERLMKLSPKDQLRMFDLMKLWEKDTLITSTSTVFG